MDSPAPPAGGIVDSILNNLHALEAIRAKMGLNAPPSWEGLHRETKGVQTSNFLVEGAKIDMTSIMSPHFHVSHSMSWGSAQFPPTYQFGTAYAKAKYSVHGQIDHEGSLQAREPPKRSSATKVTAQLSQQAGHSMVQLEQDIIGSDFSFNLKTTNPNPFDKAPSWAESKTDSSTTGIFQTAYLQSVSRSLALGAEFVLQRPAPDVEESAITFAARYAPAPTGPLPPPSTIPIGSPSPFPPVNPTDPHEIITATYSPTTSLLHTTYWRRLNQRLEVAAELQLLASRATPMGEGRREGLASVAFKLDTINASIRGQVDTAGRLACVLEERLAPGIALLLSGEIEYGKGAGGQGRVGVGFTLEM
ncbi:eukaryotic porin/Tom40 [Blyttiomyces helicus]|uniref:Eukaryotic porin/Tom40 n=1 Tax=Blyttiomyces helicus TaxID=388810 RepID=A0A4P9WDH6_9FUNG|nr:eukaryotic porin/Tom40 [Blyttiomyces helicus]|eukprot:RKO90402.1 eukaryotic porin/Tom40 [Blyttiomyces helicus]